MADQLLTAAQASARLGVHPATLRRWESLGYLKPLRTLGGHRRYSAEQLDKAARRDK